MKLRVGPLFLLLLLGVSSAIGQTFTEFQIPTANSRPKGITVGPDGNLWFTEYAVNASKIGRITPEGVITEFPLPDPVAHPLEITTGPDGNLWFTENRGPNAIGRMTPEGVIAEFGVARDANPWGIAAGPDGDLWFTAYWANDIGHITTSGTMTKFRIPPCPECDTFGQKSGPGGIVLGPDGALWFTEQDANRIGRITTSGAITEYRIPECSSGGPCGPVFITTGPDGALWFTESAANKVGRITTSGEITQFPIPTPDSEPYGIVAGPDGNLYFTESRGNKIGRITTSGTITEFPIPTPGASPWGIALGPDGALWFTEEFGNKIGRLAPPIGPLTCETDPTTMCLNAGRFRVTADWRKADGTTGQGQAVVLTPDSGYFWFFSSANIEAVVKVLNACSLSDRFWVFAAGLTNVEVTLRVVDTQSGSFQTYVNPLGAAYEPIQDTSAFSTCP